MDIQISMFDLVSEPDILDETILEGSGFEGGKDRIRKAVKDYSGNVPKVAGFLRKEYGVGGWCGPNRPKVDHNSKGLTVGMDWDNKTNYSWEQVAERIIKLIAYGKY